MYLPPRLRVDEQGLTAAFILSGRSSCPRAHVGCVLYDHNKVVVCSGYNGVPSGEPQCDEVGCVMVDGHCSRTVHAEKNAIEFAKSRGVESLPGGYAFITIRPCTKCFNELVDFGIKFIFFLNDYDNQDDRKRMDEVCRKEGIVLKQSEHDIVYLLQKVVKFHQGPGGLFVKRQGIQVIETKPD